MSSFYNSINIADSNNKIRKKEKGEGKSERKKVIITSIK
jgi:hypothetical protein